MKAISLVGVLLIVVGVLALAYQGINYTRQKKVLDVGSVHLTTETHERIPLPPILGGLALVGGVVLLVVGARNQSYPRLRIGPRPFYHRGPPSRFLRKGRWLWKNCVPF